MSSSFFFLWYWCVWSANDKIGGRWKQLEGWRPAHGQEPRNESRYLEPDCIHAFSFALFHCFCLCFCACMQYVSSSPRGPKTFFFLLWLGNSEHTFSYSYSYALPTEMRHQATEVIFIIIATILMIIASKINMIIHTNNILQTQFFWCGSFYYN